MLFLCFYFISSTSVHGLTIFPCTFFLFLIFRMKFMRDYVITLPSKVRHCKHTVMPALNGTVKLFFKWG